MKPTCPECGEQYPANGGGHCRGGRYGGCCETFTSDTTFDRHRVGPHEEDENGRSQRRCLEVTRIDGWRYTRSGWTNAAEVDPSVFPAYVKKEPAPC